MLTRWRGFEIPTAFDLFEHQFADVLGAFAPPSQWPAITLAENADAFVVEADLPGVLDKDISVVVEKDTLLLKGSRAVEVPKDSAVHRRERESATFERTIALNARVDSDAVTASLQNGVLTITLPKAKAAVARPITVKVS